MKMNRRKRQQNDNGIVGRTSATSWNVEAVARYSWDESIDGFSMNAFQVTVILIIVLWHQRLNVILCT